MSLSIGPVEAAWFALNLATLVYTLAALDDARANQKAVRLLNGHAREFATAGVVRREVFRVIVQALLLALAVPSLFDATEARFNPFVLIFIGIAVTLFLASFTDAGDRKKMTVLSAAELLAERTDAFTRLEQQNAELAAALEMNTQISQGARDDAHEAVVVANGMNEKIANLDAALLAQGTGVRADAERIESTIDETAEKVSDIHDATVKNGGAS
jgi:hypothetical protein